MYVASHPTLNENVRNATLALAERGVLGEFHTTLDTTAFLRGPLRSISQRRALPPEVHVVSHAHPVRELWRLAQRNFPALAKIAPVSVDDVYRALDCAVAQRLRASEFAAVLGYEDGCSQSFEVAKASGAHTLYDLPIGHHRAAREILAAEVDHAPDWACTLQSLTEEIDKTRRKDIELENADAVIVASAFTAKTLESIHYGGHLLVIPYGFPDVQSGMRPQRSGKSNLRALFVGGLTQRKGLSYLFASLSETTGVSLTVVGALPASPPKVLTDSLEKVLYRPYVAHADLMRMMRAHDVLLLPSLFEGYGLVLSEAMSQGMTIIATEHTAAPDLIAADPLAGFIVPVRDSEAISHALQMLADHPDRLHDMQARSAAVARTRPWSVYRAEFASTALGLIA